ncbi:MAG: hypothetical protein J6C97_02760, partial [Clostridia bacterium]|nr:hypothetical protein [Clostridia bacterium]
GITFGATITVPNDYVNNVRLFIAPYDHVEAVRGNGTITDYITAFNARYYPELEEEYKDQPVISKENGYYTIVEPAKIPYTGGVSFLGGLKNIQEGNESRRFFGIYYYYDSSAGKNEYAKMSNGEVGQARSIAFLASGHYNTVAKDDGIVSNDEYMTSFWMERAIKTAVSKSNGKLVEGNENETVDVSSIKYTEGEGINTQVISGKTSGTYFDDYLTLSGTKIQVGDKTINVGQRLNFAVKYNANDYVKNVGTAYVNTKKVTNNDVGVSVKIGREEINAQNFSVNIAKYDLAKATLTASDTKFTDTISSENNTLVDSYNSTNVTPSSIVLNVPTGGNVLWEKTLNYNDIIAIGSLNYNSTSADVRWSNYGEIVNFVELPDASASETDPVKLNLTTTLSGGSFIGSVSGSSTATKNWFNLYIQYTYSDSYEQDGNLAATDQSNKYYYDQTFNYVQTEIDGYTAYLDQNRQTQATTGIISGNVDTTVYYMPNTYTLTVGYLNTGRENTTLSVKYGYPYKVNAPTINGLSPTQNSISGNMESLGYAVNFTYNSTAYSADGNVYYQGYPVSTQANFAKASDSDILGGAASQINGNYAGGFAKTEPSVTKFYLYSSSIDTPTNGFVVAESVAFEFDLISLGSENDTEADGKFGVIIESVENSEHRNFIYLTKGSTSLKKSISYANNTNAVTEESTLIDSVGSTSGVRVSLYKKGSSITITVGTKTTTYTDENLAGNCFIGIFGVKVTYNFANAVYRVDSAKAYFAKVTNNYHSSGTSVATATYSALSGNPFIGGYTKSEGDGDKFYLFRDYSTTTSYLRAGTLFLEFEYKLTSVVSSSKTAKFGVALENSSGKHFIYFRVANGVDKKDIYINNYYADSNGQLTDSSGNVISEDNGKVDTVYSMPDVTAQFVKFSIYKNGTEVIVRVNDIIVY